MSGGLKRSAQVTAVVFLTIYLLAGFAAWDWNAAHWLPAARAILAGVAVIVSMAACSFAAAVAEFS